ncbi:unnamed protein product, partial [Effrenium voratum]
PTRDSPVVYKGSARSAHRARERLMATELRFQQVGGRCKLVLEEDFRSCLKSDIEEREGKARLREWREYQRSLREKASVAAFLKKHHFPEDDVNAPRVSCYGLRHTYPLTLAAESNDAAMVILLIRLGADPLRKDRLGYSALDRCKCSKLRRKASQLYVELQVRSKKTWLGGS